MTLANRVTIFRMLMIPVYVLFMYANFPYAQWVAAGIFLLLALTDSLDGYLARSRNEITSFGKFMDPIADKLLVLTAFIVLVGQGKMHALFAVVFVGREIVVSGFRLVAALQKNVIAAGWLGKIKTFTQILAAILLMIDNFPFSLLGLPLAQITLWASLVFTVWSGFDYIYQNRSALAFKAEK